MPAYRGVQDYRQLPSQAIMTHEIFQIQHDEDLSQALARIKVKGKKFHGYPVVDAQGLLTGVITYHELREHPGEMKVHEVIGDQKLLCITPTTTIQEAAQKMIQHDFQQVPVVGQAEPRRLLGWLTLNDIARQQNATDG